MTFGARTCDNDERSPLKLGLSSFGAFKSITGTTSVHLWRSYAAVLDEQVGFAVEDCCLFFYGFFFRPADVSHILRWNSSSRLGSIIDVPLNFKLCLRHLVFENWLTDVN